MPFWRFTAAPRLVGCIPWVLALALAGRAWVENWEELQHNLHYVDYALALAILGGIAWLVLRHRRRRLARVA